MALSSVDFQSQIASIMEVLANAAVAEICKVVDDGYAVVQLEMSQSHKESDFLRRKIKLLELQVARYRAERMKCSDASPHSRFQGVRLFNRHGRDTLTGASMQSRARLVKSSMSHRQRDSQTQSIEIDQDPQQEVVTTTRCESADHMVVEPELLIVKVEGALEIDDQEGPAETRREPTLPPVGLRDVSDVAGCSQMEVSGSDVFTVVLHQSEAQIELESTQNLLDTEGDTRAGGPNMDMPCDDMVKKEEQNSFSSSLPLGWTDESAVVAADVAACANLLDGVCVSMTAEPQTTVGCGNLPIISASVSSSGILVIDGVSPGSKAETEFDGASKCAVNPENMVRREIDCVRNSDKNVPSCHSFSETSSTKVHGNKQAFPGICPSDKDHVVSGRPVNSHLQSGKVHMSEKSSLSKSIHHSRFERVQRVRYLGTTAYGVSNFNQGPSNQSNANPMPPQFYVNQLSRDVERPFGCPSCSKRFFLETDLQRHLARHSREKAFVCQLCGKGFICQSQLDVHQNVHTGERPYSCLVCYRKFSHPSNLRRHEKGQIYQTSSLLVKEESREDSQDGTLTRFQSTALEHSAAEDKERPFSSTSMTEAVPGCSSSSPYKTNFPLNSKRFSGTSILDQNGNPAVKSDIILIDSPSNDRGDAVTPSSLWKRRDGGPAHWSRGMGPVSMAYQHHVLPGQAQDSPEQLMYSSDVNRDLTAPSASVTVATEERHQHQLLPLWVGFQDASQHPHQNPSTSVSQNQGAQSHSQPPPSRPPYSCPICGRQYLHLCQLRTHQRVHTGEKPFQCTQCGKQFGQFCSLKRHQRVHTGEKPYRCAQCGKQFSTSNNLKVHQSVHTGEKRFHCSQCGKNFSFLSNLIRHQAVHAAGK